VIAAVEEQARVEQEVIEPLRLEIQELKEKITILEKENADVKKENAGLESKSFNQQNEISSLEKKNTDLDGKSVKQENEILNLRKENTNVKEENNNLKEENTNVKEENNNLKKENTNVKEENNNQKKENTNIKEENNNLKEKNTNIKEENNNLKEENTNVKEENNNLKEENANVKEENASLKEGVAEMERKFEMDKAEREKQFRKDLANLRRGLVQFSYQLSFTVFLGRLIHVTSEAEKNAILSSLKSIPYKTRQKRISVLKEYTLKYKILSTLPINDSSEYNGEVVGVILDILNNVAVNLMNATSSREDTKNLERISVVLGRFYNYMVVSEEGKTVIDILTDKCFERKCWKSLSFTILFGRLASF
jgi:uncharacterized protein (DUF3084 family)